MLREREKEGGEGGRRIGEGRGSRRRNELGHGKGEGREGADCSYSWRSWSIDTS